MNIELLTYLVTPAAQVLIIIGLAEVVKRLGIDAKFIPLVDLVLGIAGGLLVYTLYQGMGVVEGIMLGIACGLSACGLFSGVKNVTEIIKED